MYLILILFFFSSLAFSAGPRHVMPPDMLSEDKIEKDNELKDPQKTFNTVLELLKTKSLNKHIGDSELYLGAIRGMLEAAAGKDYAKYNNVLYGNEYMEIKITTGGKLAGIGAILSLVGGDFHVFGKEWILRRSLVDRTLRSAFLLEKLCMNDLPFEKEK